MNLLKIGGAVLKDKDGFDKLVNILTNYAEKPLVIVVSAFHSATRDLRKSARYAEQGNRKEANLILNQIIDKHILFAKEICKDKNTFESLELLLMNSKRKIQDYFKGLSITGELTLRTLDLILSFGEYFALHTVKHFLKEKGFNILLIDSTSIIVSDDNYGRATPLLNQTSKKVKEKILPLMIDNNIVITQGFVAKSRSDEITTMGIESSNLTAALIAEILNIKRITFWTDVAGLRSADPKIVSNTMPIKQIGYAEAYKVSVNGLKLLYPGMIDHIQKLNIEVFYRSASEPSGDYTIINSENSNKNKFVLIQYDMIFCEENFNSISEKSNFLDNLEGKKEIFDKIKYKVFKQEKAEFVFSNKNNDLLKFFKKSGINVFKEANIISIINVNQEETLKIISKIQNKYEINIFSMIISNDISLIVSSSDYEVKPIIEYFHANIFNI